MPTVLILVDPPGPLSFPELAISNQQASPDERLIIESALRDVLKTEAEIDQVLQIAQARKQEYIEHARLMRLSLAPCRILPQEIWSQIFCVVMDLVDTSQTPPCKIRGAVSDGVPSWSLGVGERAGIPTICQLSLVCRMWRRAVLAAPYLWRYLPSETAPEYVLGNAGFGEEEESAWLARYNYALQTHLSYAGSLPLKMCTLLPTRDLDLPVNAEYFRLLTKTLPRLSFLNVFMRGERALTHFSTLPQNFDKLKTLIFSVSLQAREDQIPTPKDPPLTLFDHCPLLSEMDLNRISGSGDTHISLTDFIQIPSWSNLTRIKATNVNAVDIFRILKVSVKLIDATFKVAFGDDSQGSSGGEIVTCPTLRILDMDIPEPPLAPSFTDWLQLPVLTHLVLTLPSMDDDDFVLPVRPPCLINLTHLAFTYVAALRDTQEWVDLFATTPNVTHLKIPYSSTNWHLISQLPSTTLLPHLKMLMVDEVTGEQDSYYGDTSNEDALAFGLHLSALIAARPGMTGLKIVFADEEAASRMYAFARYSWNGWPTGSPSTCLISTRVEIAFGLLIGDLEEFCTLEPEHPDVRNSLLEAIPGIMRLSKDCKGHHITQLLINGKMDAVDVLSWLRSCLPNENVCEELWNDWQKLKAEYMNGPGWVCAEIKMHTGEVFQALEYLPSGAFHVRNSLSRGKIIQTYPDFKSNIWWSTDILLDRPNG